MAQRVVTLDDLDGSPAVETVRFGYAGREYEIDLNEKHAQELDELLAPYVEVSRRVDEAPPTRQRRARKTEEKHRGPEELRAIREWARAQGMKVSDRGRIAADIVAKYDDAH